MSQIFLTTAKRFRDSRGGRKKTVKNHKENKEYENFDRTVTDVLRVSHSDIKAKIKAEKQAKKRKKSKASSASREANDR